MRADFTVMNLRQSNNPPLGKDQTHLGPKTARQLEAKQSSLHITMTFFSDWWQENWLLHPDKALSHISFSPGNLLTKTT
jgi:hypothetical protein